MSAGVGVGDASPPPPDSVVHASNWRVLLLAIVLNRSEAVDVTGSQNDGTGTVPVDASFFADTEGSIMMLEPGVKVHTLVHGQGMMEAGSRGWEYES